MSKTEEDPEILVRLVALFSVSAGMVGVCLTAIGLVNVLRALSPLQTICDDLLALDSILFLIAAALSFLALRRRAARRRRAMVLGIESIFFAGLGLMVFVCGIFVWAVL